MVWYHYLPAARRKLSKFWQGSYIVAKKFSDVSYLIKKNDSDKSRVVHIDNLKLCLSDESIQPDGTVKGETAAKPLILGRGCRNVHPPDRYSP